MSTVDQETSASTFNTCEQDKASKKQGSAESDTPTPKCGDEVPSELELLRKYQKDFADSAAKQMTNSQSHVALARATGDLPTLDFIGVDTAHLREFKRLLYLYMQNPKEGTKEYYRRQSIHPERKLEGKVLSIGVYISDEVREEWKESVHLSIIGINVAAPGLKLYLAEHIDR